MILAHAAHEGIDQHKQGKLLPVSFQAGDVVGHVLEQFSI